tara:strand:+ start:5415 stop:6401 length:987 start_codon:yes stop_codon:yes gene_type:complete
MFLFIDTNIFLSFFHFTNDDLDELKKLIVLADTDKINLLIPTQVIDEFYRNRDNKINDALKSVRAQKLNLQFPQVCKDYDEYKVLRTLQKEYEKNHSALLSKLYENIKEETLKADQVVKELFDSSSILKTSSDIVERAKIRMAKGNPPGKDDSLGDAINWELILESIPLLEDIHFITDDKDYYSSVDSSRFNIFLKKEWEERNSSKLFFYKKLSDFFSDNFPDINLSGESEKDLLIQGLSSSTNFAQTHQLISKLKKFTDFSEAQANELVSACLSNNQIYWIIDDEDVSEFYNELLSKYEKVINKDNLVDLKHYLSLDSHEIDDELPF